jgi:hypothetical protein
MEDIKAKATTRLVDLYRPKNDTIYGDPSWRNGAITT